VPDGSNLNDAGVESWRRTGKVWLSIARFARTREGLFSGPDRLKLDRLKIGAQAPINSGDAEGLASVMEGCL